jgi:hypothetical protein
MPSWAGGEGPTAVLAVEGSQLTAVRSTGRRRGMLAVLFWSPDDPEIKNNDNREV